MINELMELGLEKYAGDQEQATAFVEGFLKEAMAFPAGAVQSFGSQIAGGAAKALGAGVVGLGLGLGIHGMSSAIAGAAKSGQRAKFEAALSTAISANSILKSANSAKLRSFAETIFEFAPHIAGDANLLAHVLSGTIHGDSLDLTTIKSLTDLESRYAETRQKAMFSPKAYA